MNEERVDAQAEELFGPFEDAAYPLSLDDALQLAEAFLVRVEAYVNGLKDDVRRRDA